MIWVYADVRFFKKLLVLGGDDCTAVRVGRKTARGCAYDVKVAFSHKLAGHISYKHGVKEGGHKGNLQGLQHGAKDGVKLLYRATFKDGFNFSKYGKKLVVNLLGALFVVFTYLCQLFYVDKPALIHFFKEFPHPCRKVCHRALSVKGYRA